MHLSCALFEEQTGMSERDNNVNLQYENARFQMAVVVKICLELLNRCRYLSCRFSIPWSFRLLPFFDDWEGHEVLWKKSKSFFRVGVFENFQIYGHIVRLTILWMMYNILFFFLIKKTLFCTQKMEIRACPTEGSTQKLFKCFFFSHWAS